MASTSSHFPGGYVRVCQTTLRRLLLLIILVLPAAGEEALAPGFLAPLFTGGPPGDGTAAAIYGYKNALQLARKLSEPGAILKITVCVGRDDPRRFGVTEPRLLEMFRVGMLQAKCRLLPVPVFGGAAPGGGHVGYVEYGLYNVSFRVYVNECVGFHIALDPIGDKTFTSASLADCLDKALRAADLGGLSREAMAILSGETDPLILLDKKPSQEDNPPAEQD